MHARDAAGLFAGASSTTAYTFARKAGKAIASPELKLEKVDITTNTGGVGASTDAADNYSDSAARAVLANPLLLSAACTIVTAYSTLVSVAACGVDAVDGGVDVHTLQRAQTLEHGWLCVTSKHLVFVPHNAPDEKHRRRTGSNSSLPRRSSTRAVAERSSSLDHAAGLGFGISGGSDGVLHQLQLSPLRLEDMVGVRE